MNVGKNRTKIVGTKTVGSKIDVSRIVATRIGASETDDADQDHARPNVAPIGVASDRNGNAVGSGETRRTHAIGRDRRRWDGSRSPAPTV